MFCSGFRGRAHFRRNDPLVWPLENSCVCGRCICEVIPARDVEGEVEEWLSAGLNEGREALFQYRSLLAFKNFFQPKLQRPFATDNIRNIIRPFQPAQFPIKLPLPIRVLTEVIHDIREPTHPGIPIPQRGQFIWFQRQRQSALVP